MITYTLYSKSPITLDEVLKKGENSLEDEKIANDSP